MDRGERGLGIEEFSVWKDGCEDSVDGIGVGKGRALRKLGLVRGEPCGNGGKD